MLEGLAAFLLALSGSGYSAGCWFSHWALHKGPSVLYHVCIHARKLTHMCSFGDILHIQRPAGAHRHTRVFTRTFHTP